MNPSARKALEDALSRARYNHGQFKKQLDGAREFFRLSRRLVIEAAERVRELEQALEEEEKT